MANASELPAAAWARIELAKHTSAEKLRRDLRIARATKGPRGGEPYQIALYFAYADYVHAIFDAQLREFRKSSEPGPVLLAKINETAQLLVASAIPMWRSSGGTEDYKDSFVETAFKCIQSGKYYLDFLNSMAGESAPEAVPVPPPEMAVAAPEPEPKGLSGRTAGRAGDSAAPAEPQREELCPADQAETEAPVGARTHSAPRRLPNLQRRRDRIHLVEKLAAELATIKPEVQRFCTVEELKKRHSEFLLWEYLDGTELRELVNGSEFKPKAYAESLVLRKYGLTSRETLKKDRKAIRKAEQDG